MRLLVCLAVSAALVTLPACTTVQTAAEPAPASVAAPEAAHITPLWAFEESDVPVDPAFRFGVLENGMRYILRENATPEGTALVRLHIGSGSLDETDSEQGLAHYLEHMAFNGSTNVPEGEMIRLLERKGLAFGADTNASTGFETTTYKLDLPKAEEDLLETALMLMRETASELTIAPDAVERERGVILAEQRDRFNFSYKETIDRFSFIAPDARFVNRLPIGKTEILKTATAADLRGFYERTYVPENATLVIVGDFPADLLEARVKHWFFDWSAGPDPVEPQTGPFDSTRRGDTDIHIDPALSEQLSIFTFGSWQDRPDTVANRQQGILRQVGYGIINRRLASLARGADAPFRSAAFSTSDIFEDGRSTALTVNSENGDWRKGMEAATRTVRQALAYGFSDAEVAEQVANIRTSLEDSVKGAATRSNAALVNAALSLIDEERIPSTPESSLARFEAFADQITAEAAWDAVLADAIPLANPLIRLRGREAPAGGAEALRAAWEAAAAEPIAQPDFGETVAFAYTGFGEPGSVVSDIRDERFGFRLIRFANGVRLNLKQTDIRQDQVQYRLSLDGGDLLNTKEAPLTTALVATLPSGGLGKHSQDELATVLAGRSVELNLRSDNDTFIMSGDTTPRDLELQLQVLAAALTDPGYRAEGEERFRRSIADFFARRDATPGNALSNALGGILSDNDPRFTLQDEEDYRALTFAKLREDISERWAKGAIELALVGDFDEEAAIAAVAGTLGALEPREADFLPREEARKRSFTDQRGLRTIAHSGEDNQALVRMTWPTGDDRNLAETLRLAVLARVMRIELQEQLREDLGKSYSPSASSSPSRTYRGYGTFALAASVDLADLDETRAAIRVMLDQLLAGPVDQDLLDRARQPLLESYDNLLKSLGGWMTLADRAQSEADRLERFQLAPGVLKSITPEELYQTAQSYLAPDAAVEVVVLPQTAAELPLEQ
ncbi:M16 family metallopeptidase [Altererythrobacter sp. GH1-8]|uniref:M16 family metallopeptidase n=1 Tax=Altererythrobacter sp. GH1-8 TaxID=3349333 RepID=UPI00374D8D0A